MTKNKALYAWFNEFMPFCRASSVPNDVVFPYGTYEYVESAFDGGENGMTVNLWFYTASEAIPDAKAQEFSELIGHTGVKIPCDGGFIMLTRGSPWCQSLKDENDASIKRRYINLTAKYYTVN